MLDVGRTRIRWGEFGRELDRHATSLQKLAAEESLIGELSRAQVALQQAESEAKQQADLIAALRADEGQLEAALYEVHQALGSCCSSPSSSYIFT